MEENNAIILTNSKYTLGRIEILKKCPPNDLKKQIEEALKSKSNHSQK